MHFYHDAELTAAEFAQYRRRQSLDETQDSLAELYGPLQATKAVMVLFWIRHIKPAAITFELIGQISRATRLRKITVARAIGQLHGTGLIGRDRIHAPCVE
jgi:hypothetical protein